MLDASSPLPTEKAAAPARRRPIALRALLYEASWRRADLGRALGLSPSVTSRIFDGIRPLTLDEGSRLARALSVRLNRHVSIDELVEPTE